MKFCNTMRILRTFNNTVMDTRDINKNICKW